MTDAQKEKMLDDLAKEAELLDKNSAGYADALLALYYKAVDAGFLRFGDDTSWIELGNPSSFDVHPEVFARINSQHTNL